MLHPAELRTDLIVICATGTDSPTAASINARSDARFRANEISPDDPQFLLSLDRQVRTARAAALLLTRSSLPRFSKKGSPSSPKSDCVRLAAVVVHFCCSINLYSRICRRVGSTCLMRRLFRCRQRAL